MIVPKSSHCTRRTLFCIVGTTILTGTMIIIAFAPQKSQDPNVTKNLRRRLGVGGRFGRGVGKITQRGIRHGYAMPMQAWHPVIPRLPQPQMAQWQLLFQQMPKVSSTIGHQSTKQLWKMTLQNMNLVIKFKELTKSFTRWKADKIAKALTRAQKAFGALVGAGSLDSTGCILFAGIVFGTDQCCTTGVSKVVQQSLQNSNVVQMFLRFSVDLISKHIGGHHSPVSFAKFLKEFICSRESIYTKKKKAKKAVKKMTKEAYQKAIKTVNSALNEKAEDLCQNHTLDLEHETLMGILALPKTYPTTNKGLDFETSLASAIWMYSKIKPNALEEMISFRSYGDDNVIKTECGEPTTREADKDDEDDESPDEKQPEKSRDSWWTQWLPKGWGFLSDFRKL